MEERSLLCTGFWELEGGRGGEEGSRDANVGDLYMCQKDGRGFSAPAISGERISKQL